jgi:hypothetical protein
MKNFFRIFKYIRIPKNKLALYLLYTVIATLFSLLSINALAPFMNIIFKADSTMPSAQPKSLGRFNDFFQLLIRDHGALYALGYHMPGNGCIHPSQKYFCLPYRFTYPLHYAVKS